MKRNSSLFLFFILLAFPLFSGFDLEGRVRLQGKPPRSVWFGVLEEHQADCGTAKISPRLKVSWEGGLASAVVWVEGDFPPESPAPGKNYTIDQIRCQFSPHIQMIPKGVELSILNSDGFLHNVRAFDERAEMLFNDAMPKKGQILKKRFERPAIILLRCGIHHWMHAIVVVRGHPYYALTNESGRFKISGIPNGNYTLHVWHQALGELKKEVGPDTSRLELIYPAKRQ